MKTLGAVPARGEGSARGVPLLAALYSGFDPDFYRWWDRAACHHGHCERGFDFHAMGLPHGQHVIAKTLRAQAGQRERKQTQDSQGSLL